MATHYTSTTVTKYHSNYGVYGDYKKVWYQFAITVTISAAGAVTYSITSTNNVNAIKGWSGCQTSAWIEINGTTVLSADQYGSGFPRDNNSTKSGSAGTTSSGSVTIKTKIIPGSDYTGWTAAWDASLITSTVSRSYWTDIGTGSVTITDNGNNSYTVSGTKGGAGTNNAVNGATLYWASGKNSAGNWDYSYQSFSTGSSKTVSFTPTSAASRTVAGAVVTDGVYNDTDTGWITKSIKQYKDPDAPGKPTLDSSSYRNGRLTIKQNWKYTWTAGTDGTGSCPVLGYRIRIYKNGSLVTGFSAGSNSVLNKNSGTNEYVDRSGKTDCTIILNPVSFGFVPGDTIQVGIYAYAQNGAGTWLYNGGGTGAAQVLSDSSTVQNSGVMRVRPEGSWKEGVVWVKVNNAWKEAEVVHTKVSDSWKEST